MSDSSDEKSVGKKIEIIDINLPKESSETLSESSTISKEERDSLIKKIQEIKNNGEKR